MDEDWVLLERYERGDEGAFTELVCRHQRTLYRAAYRMVGRSEDAVDLAQQAFINLFTHRQGFRREAKLKTWLYQILINLCKNFLRDSARRRPVDREIEEIEGVDTKTALDSMIRADSRRKIRRAIERLPDRQRATLVLRVYEEQSFEAIAQILGCRVGTAKANYHHAFRNLRRLLEEE